MKTLQRKYRKNKELDQTWKSKDVQEEYKRWTKVVNKILRESLGKIRISDKNKQGIDNEVRLLMQEKRKIRRQTSLDQCAENRNVLIERRKEIESRIKKKWKKMKKNC